MGENRQAQSLTQLETMIGAPPGFLPEPLLEQALTSAVIPDENGRLPTEPDWKPTWDMEWAAAQACQLAALRQAANPTESVKRVASEGTTIEIDKPTTDWGALAHAWLKRSKLAQQLGVTGGIQLIDLPRVEAIGCPTSQGLAGGGTC